MVRKPSWICHNGLLVVVMAGRPTVGTASGGTATPTDGS